MAEKKAAPEAAPEPAGESELPMSPEQIAIAKHFGRFTPKEGEGEKPAEGEGSAKKGWLG